MKAEILVRLSLIDILHDILENHYSLSNILPRYLKKFSDPRDQSLIQFCAYGICRDFFLLDFYIQQLSVKKIKNKKIYYLLLISLYQLQASRIPSFAVVNTAVNTAKHLKLYSESRFINAVLREFLRRKDDLKLLEKPLMIEYSHPLWLIQLLQHAWPQEWRDICHANNEQAPMCLRINTLKIKSDAYQALLEKNHLQCSALENESCYLKEPIDVTHLPGFAQGLVSVQDRAAQYAAKLLDLKPEQRVLDACAAPGGKTCHILESQTQLQACVAIDKDPQRILKIHENLQRLQLQATVIMGDALNPAKWWDKQLFDRILLDAPCSATGVIRRHPDIKILRQESDIALMAKQQLGLLIALWPLLKPQGKLLYATCSILPPENEDIIDQFCQQQTDASCISIQLPHGLPTKHGWQILPGDGQCDGFFYSLLYKA